MGKHSYTYQDPDKVKFSFSSYNLNDDEKSVLYKGLNFAIPPKATEYSEFLVLFEMLFSETICLDICNFNKECVKSRLRNRAYSLFKQVIQKADKENNIVILSRSDYMPKLSEILEDTPKFK